MRLAPSRVPTDRTTMMLLPGAMGCVPPGIDQNFNFITRDRRSALVSSKGSRASLELLP